MKNINFEMNFQYRKKYLDGNFNINKVCPLCKNNEQHSRTSKYKNVYSELISKHLQIEENNLLDFCLFKHCSKCSIFYWEKELSRNLRYQLYEKILPKHPKASDASGKYFSLEGLKQKINSSKDDKNHIKRIKEGYISSFIFKNNVEKISTINCFKDFNDDQNIERLKILFDRGPKKLSRHAGFRKTLLNNFIIKEIGKSNSNKFQYIEYGCPTWGPLKTLIEQNYNCLSILPKTSIFWNKYPNNSKNLSNLLTINEEEIYKKNYDFKGSVLGLILILDHLEDPLSFLNNFLNLGVTSIAIIVEKINFQSGLPIQHLTGWTKDSLNYLANTLGLKVQFVNQDDQNYIFTLFKK